MNWRALRWGSKIRNLENSKERFWIHDLAITPPGFLVFPVKFSEKKKLAGSLGQNPLMMSNLSIGATANFSASFCGLKAHGGEGGGEGNDRVLWPPTAWSQSIV